MNVSVMQENLARGLSVVSRAVSTRSTLPVLGNVLIRTEDAGLKLTATNLEIGITYWVPGKIDKDGAITVPARLLTDIVAGPPDERAGRARAAGRRHAPYPLRQVRIARQGHRRRGVPGHPVGRRAADDPDLPEGPQAGPPRDHVRRGQRRGPADPDRRPVALRGRAADPGRGRQLPDRGQDHRHARSGRGHQPGDPRPVAHRARPGAQRHRRSGRGDARPGPQPGPLPPRGDRPRQPADRRPVPQLPAGPAQGPHDPDRGRPRGALQGGQAGGPDRQRRGQHRQARGQRGWRWRRRHGRGRGRRQRGPGRGHGRGRRDDDRVQLALPLGCPPERRPPSSSRSSSTGPSRRASSGRSATTRTPTWSCPSAPPRSGGNPDTGGLRRARPGFRTTARAADPDRPAGLSRPGACPRTRPPPAPRAECGRQDQPARGDRPAVVRPLAPHARPTPR